MPRIGNEARLILKLSRERVKTDYDVMRIKKASTKDAISEAVWRGVEIGIKAYQSTFTQIQRELEERE